MRILIKMITLTEVPPSCTRCSQFRSHSVTYSINSVSTDYVFTQHIDTMLIKCVETNRCKRVKFHISRKTKQYLVLQAPMLSSLGARVEVCLQ